MKKSKKAKKYRQKPLVLCRNLYVCLCVCGLKLRIIVFGCETGVYTKQRFLTVFFDFFVICLMTVVRKTS